MGTDTILVGMIAAVIVLGVVATVWTRNLLYAAFFLMFTFLGVASAFVLMNAEFVAISQIVVYVGGVLVLIIFGILLTNRIDQKRISSAQSRLIPGLILSSLLLYILVTALLSHSSFELAVLRTTDSASLIGINLMTENLLVFELIAVLLLVALVGAASIVKDLKR